MQRLAAAAGRDGRGQRVGVRAKVLGGRVGGEQGLGRRLAGEQRLQAPPGVDDRIDLQRGPR